jgi:hypothetical protein
MNFLKLILWDFETEEQQCKNIGCKQTQNFYYSLTTNLILEYFWSHIDFPDSEKATNANSNRDPDKKFSKASHILMQIHL